MYSAGAVVREGAHPERVDHAREVVAEHHNAHLPTDFLEAAHQKVIPAEPTLEGAERVFDPALCSSCT